MRGGGGGTFFEVPIASIILVGNCIGVVLLMETPIAIAEDLDLTFLQGALKNLDYERAQIVV